MDAGRCLHLAIMSFLVKRLTFFERIRWLLRLKFPKKSKLRPDLKKWEFEKIDGILIMKILNSVFCITLTVAMSFLSCGKEEIVTDVAVFTEEVVYASGESVIMTGRMLAAGQIAVEDHGFQIDTDENFSAPVVVSLGEKEIPGRFVGETNMLDIRVRYFCRSYIVIDGEPRYGNVLEFFTLSPKAVGFTPQEGNPGITVTAEGRNLTNDTRIIWNGKVLTPDKISAETFVEFTVPPIENLPAVYFKLVSQGDTLTFDKPFEYIIGTWNLEGPLNDPDKNTRHIHFEDGDEFVYGLGLSRGIMTSLVQVLNKNTLQRTTLVFPGTPTEGAFFNKTYFGGGSANKVLSPVAQLTLSKEFWKYENQGFVQLADMPVGLYNAVCLVAGNEVFVYGGELANRNRNPFIYVYNISADSWSVHSATPQTFSNLYPAFNSGNFNYFVTPDRKTHRHNFVNDVWQTVANFPVIPKEDGISIELDGKIYVGMQSTDRSLYVYLPNSETWRTKRTQPGGLVSYNTIGAWTNNGLLYVVRTESSNFINRFYWSFDPDGI